MAANLGSEGRTCCNSRNDSDSRTIPAHSTHWSARRGPNPLWRARAVGRGVPVAPTTSAARQNPATAKRRTILPKSGAIAPHVPRRFAMRFGQLTRFRWSPAQTSVCSPHVALATDTTPSFGPSRPFTIVYGINHSGPRAAARTRPATAKYRTPGTSGTVSLNRRAGLGRQVEEGVVPDPRQPQERQDQPPEPPHDPVGEARPPVRRADGRERQHPRFHPQPGDHVPRVQPAHAVPDDVDRPGRDLVVQ